MTRVLSKRVPRVARVLLRLPADLHRALSAAAATRGVSFNEWCVRRLRVPPHPEETSPVRALVIDRARAVFGTRLRGVIVLGSWARGEAAAESDIDVLIVIAPDVPLTRDIYRTWDRVPLSFEGRPIDVHVVHLSRPETPATGVWCEAAVDGLVWYDSDGGITSRLVQIRRAIADGRVIRAVAHGQPYLERSRVMRNRELAADHLRRAGARLRALDVLFESRSWADVVRESQEIVELTLKGLLRASGVEPPRIHDVADVLVAERARLPPALADHVAQMADVSRALRRDRELAFYGAEDLTPSAFYREADAVLARNGARAVVALVRPHVADA